MADVGVILGPPGTGKTTTLMNRISALLESGVPSYEIGFYSFTKAACKEARDRAASRFDLDPNPDGPDLGNFRTIHSQAFRFVGKDHGDVMKDKHWSHFAQWANCDFSRTDEQGESLLAPALTTDGDKLRSIWDLSRLCRCSIEESMRRIRFGLEFICPADVITYAKKLGEYKQQERLLDFTDMLEIALKVPKRLGTSHVFFDEAQDNCRLQWELIEHWALRSSRVQSVIIAGDDDQAIFEFAGAEPDHLIRLAGLHDTETLKRSHRVPRLPWVAAVSIIKQNRNRIDKPYDPKEDDGEVCITSDFASSLSEANEENHVMALVRNKMFADAIHNACLSAGLLFTAECGNHAPLQSAKTREAFLAISWLKAGRQIPPEWFASLIDSVPKKDGDIVIRPHGILAKSERNQEPVTADSVARIFGCHEIMRRIGSEKPFELFQHLGRLERSYLAKVHARDPLLEKPCAITLSSIHKSKGREADSVIIASDMASASFRELSIGNREGENRLAYVAATRTRRKLTIVRPSTPRYYDYQRHIRAA